MYWLRNTQPHVFAVPGALDARLSPLHWTAAGTTHAWRVVTAETLANVHVARLVESGMVVPDPAYDAAHTGRALAAVRAEYAKVFGGKGVQAASAPVPPSAAEVAAKAAAKAEAEAAAKAEAEAAAKAEAEAAAVETSTSELADTDADTSAAEPAETPEETTVSSDTTADMASDTPPDTSATPGGKKKRR